VTLCLHLPRDPATTPVPPAPPLARGGGETLLVVEDGIALRDICARLLASIGYHVLVAADGAEALAVAAAHQGPIHLLFTDVRMPLMSGYELARRLSDARPGLSVLVTSGFADEAGEADRAWPLLDKPYTPEELTTRVRALLDEASAARVGP